MASRRARLDEYVRQATRLDADKATTLIDPDFRRAILEEVMTMQTSQPPTPSRAWSQRRVRVAAVAAVLAVAAAVTFVSIRMLGSSDPTPESVASGAGEVTASGPSGDLFGSAGLSCVEQYSPASLADRGFAFAGSVARIGTADAAAADPDVPVTFTVERWFRGGRGDEVTVAMFPPGAVSSVGGTPYKVGSRLLVSGERRGVGERPDELLAWACGFTRWYSAGDAGAWDGAFR